MARDDRLPRRLLLPLLLFLFGEIFPLSPEQLCELLSPSFPLLLYSACVKLSVYARYMTPGYVWCLL